MIDPRPPRALALAAMALAALVAAAPASAQDFSPEQIQEILARHAEAAEPGPEHERLASMVGRWDATISIWPTPGSEPMGAEAAIESSMILGGRFLVQRADIVGGMFAGESYTVVGFDRRSGEYTWLALDTTGTYWVQARGIPDEDGNRVVLSGRDHDAIAGADQIYDVVVTWLDDGTIKQEIIFKDVMHTGGGAPHRMVEIVSRRADDEAGGQ